MSDAKPWAPFKGDLRPVETIGRAQISLVLGLEDVLVEHNLILTCPRCAADGHATLATDNHPQDEIWKMHCPHLRRLAMAAGATPLTPSGDLLLMVSEMLLPLSLDVRCPKTSCVNHPLLMLHTPAGLTVTCRCKRRDVPLKAATTPH